MSRASPVRLTLGAIVVALPLAGCQNLERRETISYGAGDAVAWNRAVHTIDPWPPASANTHIPTSGRRVARAIELYENGGAPPAAAPAPIALVPVAPIAPGGAAP